MEIVYRKLTDLSLEEIGILQSMLIQSCSFNLAVANIDKMYVAFMHNGRDIVSMFTWIHTLSRRNKKFIQIYNVCTHKNYRGRGYAKKLISQFVITALIEYPGASIWLGIELSNIRAARLYTGLGFIRPRLTLSDVSGELLGFEHPVITFLYVVDSSAEMKSWALKFAHAMARIYNFYVSPEYSLEKVSVNLGPRANLYDLLYNQTIEWGGHFVRHGNELQTSTVYPGSTETLTVNMPPYNNMFHTHPEHAYTTAYGTGLASYGNPSVPDIMFSIIHYKTITTQFVYALEGLYAFALDPVFRLFIQYLELAHPKCLERLAILIGYYFNVENSRIIAEMPTLELAHAKADDWAAYANSLDTDFLFKTNFYVAPFHVAGFNISNRRHVAQLQCDVDKCYKTFSDINLRIFYVHLHKWTANDRRKMKEHINNPVDFFVWKSVRFLE